MLPGAYNVGRFMIPTTLSLDLQDLIKRMMAFDPRDRIHVRDIPEHPWFQRHARAPAGTKRGWQKRLPLEPRHRLLSNGRRIRKGLARELEPSCVIRENTYLVCGWGERELICSLLCFVGEEEKLELAGEYILAGNVNNEAAPPDPVTVCVAPFTDIDADIMATIAGLLIMNRPDDVEANLRSSEFCVYIGIVYMPMRLCFCPIMARSIRQTGRDPILSSHHIEKFDRYIIYSPRACIDARTHPICTHPQHDWHGILAHIYVACHCRLTKEKIIYTLLMRQKISSTSDESLPFNPEIIVNNVRREKVSE